MRTDSINIIKNPHSGDTITVSGITYIFKSECRESNHIQIGLTAQESKNNFLNKVGITEIQDYSFTSIENENR